MSSHLCPVCQTYKTQILQVIDDKIYWRCTNCQARFLDRKHLPSGEQELAQYKLHQNIPDDPGYKEFLSRLATPLIERLNTINSTNLRGLDYGCGPGPALANMLAEAGFEMTVYDPFFYPENSVLDNQYDFITCSETAEHFHNASLEFAKFDAMLKPQGTLAIMTTFQTDDRKFAHWHYRRDPTHVVFYREETFEFIAEKHGWSLVFPGKNVVFFTMPPK